MKEENCFACDMRTKRKKRSGHWKTLSREEQDDRSTTLINAMEKNEVKNETTLRSKFEPLLLKIIRYRTYKQSDKEKFKTVFLKYLREVNSSDLSVEVFKCCF